MSAPLAAIACPKVNSIRAVVMNLVLVELFTEHGAGTLIVR